MNKQKTFFTGKACKHGHIAARWISSRACTKCEQLRHIQRRTNPIYRVKENERTAKYHAEHRKIDGEKYRANERKRRALNKTGFSPELFEAKWIEQNGRCAICLRTLSLNNARRDHCHDTKRPRGLLCNTCNLAEGLIKSIGSDPVEWANNLKLYLLRNAERGQAQVETEISMQDACASERDRGGTAQDRDVNAALNTLMLGARSALGTEIVPRERRTALTRMDRVSVVQAR